MLWTNCSHIRNTLFKSTFCPELPTWLVCSNITTSIINSESYWSNCETSLPALWSYSLICFKIGNKLSIIWAISSPYLVLVRDLLAWTRIEEGIIEELWLSSNWIHFRTFNSYSFRVWMLFPGPIECPNDLMKLKMNLSICLWFWSSCYDCKAKGI